jgi:hypothetical protein
MNCLYQADNHWRPRFLVAGAGYPFAAWSGKDQSGIGMEEEIPG